MQVFLGILFHRNDICSSCQGTSRVEIAVLLSWQYKAAWRWDMYSTSNSHRACHRKYNSTEPRHSSVCYNTLSENTTVLSQGILQSATTFSLKIQQLRAINPLSLLFSTLQLAICDSCHFVRPSVTHFIRKLWSIISNIISYEMMSKMILPSFHSFSSLPYNFFVSWDSCQSVRPCISLFCVFTL